MLSAFQLRASLLAACPDPSGQPAAPTTSDLRPVPMDVPLLALPHKRDQTCVVFVTASFLFPVHQRSLLILLRLRAPRPSGAEPRTRPRPGVANGCARSQPGHLQLPAPCCRVAGCQAASVSCLRDGRPAPRGVMGVGCERNVKPLVKHPAPPGAPPRSAHPHDQLHPCTCLGPKERGRSQPQGSGRPRAAHQHHQPEAPGPATAHREWPSAG